MIDKDPGSYEWITYIWVMGLASWGGVVNYVRKVKANQVERFSIMEVLGEIMVSAFTGVLTFWLCELSGFPQLLTAALVGVSGHMGGRGIALVEHMIKVRAGIRDDCNSTGRNR